jgi:hypothetical protein
VKEFRARWWQGGAPELPEPALGRGGCGGYATQDACKGSWDSFWPSQVLTPHQRQEVLQRLSEGAVQVDLARTYGASQATISRLPAPIPVEASAASPREVGVPNGNVARAPRLASSVQKVGHPAGQGARGSKAAGDQAVGCGSPNCFPTPSPRSPPSSHHQLDRHHQRASA